MAVIQSVAKDPLGPGQTVRATAHWILRYALDDRGDYFYTILE